MSKALTPAFSRIPTRVTLGSANCCDAGPRTVKWAENRPVQGRKKYGLQGRQRSCAPKYLRLCEGSVTNQLRVFECQHTRILLRKKHTRECTRLKAHVHGSLSLPTGFVQKKSVRLRFEERYTFAGTSKLVRSEDLWNSEQLHRLAKSFNWSSRNHRDIGRGVRWTCEHCLQVSLQTTATTRVENMFQGWKPENSWSAWRSTHMCVLLTFLKLIWNEEEDCASDKKKRRSFLKGLEAHTRTGVVCHVFGSGIRPEENTTERTIVVKCCWKLWDTGNSKSEHNSGIQPESFSLLKITWADLHTCFIQLRSCPVLTMNCKKIFLYLKVSVCDWANSSNVITRIMAWTDAQLLKLYGDRAVAESPVPGRQHISSWNVRTIHPHLALCHTLFQFALCLYVCSSGDIKEVVLFCGSSIFERPEQGDRNKSPTGSINHSMCTPVLWSRWGSFGDFWAFLV